MTKKAQTASGSIARLAHDGTAAAQFEGRRIAADDRRQPLVIDFEHYLAVPGAASAHKNFLAGGQAAERRRAAPGSTAPRNAQSKDATARPGAARRRRSAGAASA